MLIFQDLNKDLALHTYRKVKSIISLFRRCHKTVINFLYSVRAHWLGRLVIIRPVQMK